MTSTTSKRGAGAKFLALLASLTMIVVGLVGVSLAAPASADPEVTPIVNLDPPVNPNPPDDKKVWICHADMAKGKKGGPLGGAGGPGGEYQTGWNVIQVSKNAWEDKSSTHTQHPLDVYLKDATPSEKDPDASECPSIAIYTYSKQETITKTICKAPRTIENASAKGDDISVTQNTPFTDEEKSAIDTEALDSAKAAFEKKYAPYTEGACPGEYTYSKQETVTKAICKAGATIGDASATGELISESQNEQFSDQQKAAINAEALASANAAFNTKYGEYGNGACPPPPPPGCTENCNPVVTEEPPAPVVAPAVVEAPALAAVAVPAPATVAVPAAATVPAAVPAGEGSGSTIPMWALAMIVLGAAGMATAGLKLVRASK